MTEHYYALIMAGGGGTRLWPMSRRDKPKQMLSLVEEHSMFRISVERFSPAFPPERIYVVTGQAYVAGLQADCPEIPAQNFVVEPSARNTAPAAGLAIATIQRRDPQATVVLLTADHHIGKKDVFRDVLAAAHDIAQDGYIVTLGISPAYPSTGFGYIRQGERLLEQRGFTAHIAREFTEKPNLPTATQFLASGEYTWNSGMFVWKADVAMGDSPDSSQPCTPCSPAFRPLSIRLITRRPWPRPGIISPKTPSTSPSWKVRKRWPSSPWISPGVM
ncbi:NTP transferase domain-containing protein [bacterium]|nr:NTP transferase domain-containing protein [bacterium]